MTGEPGCGKTTAIRRVLERLGPIESTGFTTEEVRDEGHRAGFRGITLDGREFPLARIGASGGYQVGPYGVLVEGLERIGVPALEPRPGVSLVVVDEIGKMESFSEAFRSAIDRLLDADVPVVGTVALHGVGFVKRVRQDPRVRLVRMSRTSRDAVVGEVVRLLADAGITPRQARAPRDPERAPKREEPSTPGPPRPRGTQRATRVGRGRAPKEDR